MKSPVNSKGHAAEIFDPPGLRAHRRKQLPGSLVGRDELGCHTVGQQSSRIRQAQVSRAFFALDQPTTTRHRIDLLGEKGARRLPKFGLEGGRAQSLALTQRQKDRLAPRFGLGKPLDLTHSRGIGFDPRFPFRQRPRIGSARAVGMGGTSNLSRMSTETEAEHGLALPVAGIVLRAESDLSRITRNLVASVPRRFEARFDLERPLRGLVLIAAAHATGGQSSAERGFRLEGQFVSRNVFGRPFEEFVEVSAKSSFGLRGPGKNQIDRKIVESRTAGGFQGLARDGCAMRPPQPLEHAIVKGLHADGQPVDAGLTKTRQTRQFHGARIEFEGGLDRALSRR